MSRRSGTSKKGSKGMLDDSKVMEALNRLLKEAPMQYYSDTNAKWVLDNMPDTENEEMYKQWVTHVYRVRARGLVKELRENFARMLERILQGADGVSDTRIIWEEWYPTISFKLFRNDASARIVVDNKGAIGYEIYVDGDGIFIDLANKKVGYDPKLGNYNRIYGMFNYDNIGELHSVLKAMLGNCRSSINVDNCRRVRMERIRKALGLKETSRA